MGEAMLCEKCHQQEANVHVTLVDAPYGDVTKHDYCESCYREQELQTAIQSAGWTSYVPLRTDEGK